MLVLNLQRPCTFARPLSQPIRISGRSLWPNLLSSQTTTDTASSVPIRTSNSLFLGLILFGTAHRERVGLATCILVKQMSHHEALAEETFRLR